MQARTLTAVLAALIHLIPAHPAGAQMRTDTLFTWQGYGQTGQCRVRIYDAPADGKRPVLVVLQEVAQNDGPSTADDLSHLAELIGRAYGIDPAGALWVLHWGAFSFDSAVPDRDRELFLRAIFRRTPSGALGSPSWRLLTRADVEELTDRQFR